MCRTVHHRKKRVLGQQKGFGQTAKTIGRYIEKRHISKPTDDHAFHFARLWKFFQPFLL